MRGGLLRDTALASLFFLLATVVFTWPIAAHVTDGLGDIWDAKLNAWILHWDFHQTFRDPLHLYDANIFYPARYALAFSENLIGAALFAFPLYAAGVSTLVAYNFVFLLGMFLSAMAAWALARDVTGDPVASAVAGLIYAFCPWRIAHIPHIQFQWGVFLALALLFLLRYLDGGGRRDLVLFSVCFAWNALCNVHYALFSGLLVAVVLAYRGLVAGWNASRRRLGGVATAAAAAGMVVVPFFLPYAIASKLYGMERGYGEIELYSGVWTAFLNPGGQNKLYAPLAQKFGKPEGELFPGVAAIVLAAMALARRRRVAGNSERRFLSARRRRLAVVLDVLLATGAAIWIASLSGRTTLGGIRIEDSGRIAVLLTLLLLARLATAFPRRSGRADLGDFLRRSRVGTAPGLFLAIAVLGIVVALGTHTPYYRFLVQSFGALFRAIRAPARGVVLFDLALGVLAALGLSDWTRSKAWAARLGLVLAVLVVVGVEYRAFPVETHPVEAKARPVDRWLASSSFSGGVVEWPLGNWFDQEYEFRSTAHWKPLVNGSSGFMPRSYEELTAALEKRPIPDAVWDMLSERKTALLLFHPGQGEADTSNAYAEAVRRGLARGRLQPVRSFPHGDHRDLVFRFPAGPAAALQPTPDAEAARLELRRMESLLNPPFGFLDSPGEGEMVASGAWAFGWALDDSGIAEVLVSADGGPPYPVAIGQPHPGVVEAYPGYESVDKPGFGFALPALPPGPHTLTIVAKDGGKTDLPRRFVMR
jgi:hypothetical protein